MGTVRRMVLMGCALALMAGAGACGDGGDDDAGSSSGDGEERTVLVDYRHDQFASAFLRYYPEQVQVRPGDTVRFKQAWTGEPHSVTMGKVVDRMFSYEELLKQYDSEEEALAAGVSQEQVDGVLASFASIPGMTGDGYEVYQAGAQPCFIPDVDDVPQFSDPRTEEINDEADCPTKGRAQPAFTGREGLYNSGFISPEGDEANTFVLPVAEDAEPGTYRYFCNYHWTSMSGTVEIVAPDATIPSQSAVSRQARKEIQADAEVALQRVKEARSAKGRVDDLELPLAGREADDEFAVIINEFLPSKVTAKVGRPVTWTFDGISHTVSFNVPKYFPVFHVKKGGEVEWNPKAYEPVGWDVPPRPEGDGGPEGPEPEGRKIDVGTWDGKGGFRSSGSLDPGETFSVTFTRPGTYPYACVLHPQMVGTVTVKA